MKRVLLVSLFVLCIAGTASASPFGYWVETYNGGGPGQPGNILWAGSCDPIAGGVGCMSSSSFLLYAALVGFTAPPESLGGGVTRYTTAYGGQGANLHLFGGNPFGRPPGIYDTGFNLTVLADIGPLGEYLAGWGEGGAAIDGLPSSFFEIYFELRRIGTFPAGSNVFHEAGHYGDMNAVPEPATLTLVGLGLLSASRLRRRK